MAGWTFQCILEYKGACQQYGNQLKGIFKMGFSPLCVCATAAVIKSKLGQFSTNLRSTSAPHIHYKVEGIFVASFSPTIKVMELDSFQNDFDVKHLETFYNSTS